MDAIVTRTGDGEPFTLPKASWEIARRHCGRPQKLLHGLLRRLIEQPDIPLEFFRFPFP